MADRDPKDSVTTADEGRRKLLKTVAAAGGAVAAASLLPGGWSKPVALVGSLPAHAQTSQVPIRLMSPSIDGASYILQQQSGPDVICTDAGVGGTITGIMIRAHFSYHDPEGGMSEDVHLHTKVKPGGCEQDKAIKKYPFAYLGCSNPADLPSDGCIYFNMTTPCVSGNRLQWYLHTGDRGSDQVLSAEFTAKL